MEKIDKSRFGWVGADPERREGWAVEDWDLSALIGTGGALNYGGYSAPVHWVVTAGAVILGVVPAVLYDRRTRRRSDFQFEIIRKL